MKMLLRAVPVRTPGIPAPATHYTLYTIHYTHTVTTGHQYTIAHKRLLELETKLREDWSFTITGLFLVESTY